MGVRIRAYDLWSECGVPSPGADEDEDEDADDLDPVPARRVCLILGTTRFRQSDELIAL